MSVEYHGTATAAPSHPSSSCGARPCVQPADGRAAGWKRSQWLFLADESVAGADAWLLAVQLKGPAAAVDWLDPVAEAGALVTLRCAEGPVIAPLT
jgi:hypothetical protein